MAGKSGQKVGPLTEGYIIKGGINKPVSQIVTRPAPAPPMKPAPTQPKK
jgi:hypothetical protein